jgi:hypothetical protein
MANKKLNQLVTKPSIASGDLFPIADVTTGQLYKTTISDLGTAIGSGVSSVNGLVGAVVLDTDDIQELASPVNKWYTDLRARAALSAGTGISYSSSTGVIASTITQYTDALARGAISLTTTGSNGSATYNSTTGVLNVPAYTLSGLGGQPLAGNLTALAGLSYSSLGFIKMTGVGTLALDTNTYLTTSDAASTYALDSAVVKLSGNQTVAGQKTFTSTLYGTSGSFSGSLFSSYSQISGVTGSNALYITHNSSYNSLVVVQSGSGAAIYADGNIFANQFIKIGGSSTGFLKADGSVDSNTYLTTSSASSTYLPLAGGTLTGALNGTSATFSGRVTGNGGISSKGGYATFEYNSAGAYPSYNTYFGAIGTNFSNGGSELDIWNTVGSGFVFRKQTGASAQTALLTIASSGAATFSSSVTTQSHVFLNNGALNFGGTGSASSTDPAIYRVGSGVNDLAIAIGSSERFRITSAGNVGIGTTAPSWKLDVRGTSMFNGNLQIDIGETDVPKNLLFNANSTTGGSYGALKWYNVQWDGNTRAEIQVEGDGALANGRMVFKTGASGSNAIERLRIQSAGNVVHKAYNVGEGILMNFNGGATYGFYNNNSGALTLTNSGVANVGVFNMTTGIYTPTSDVNKKKDFEESNIGLSEILQLKPTLYRMKSEDEDAEKQLGFIAQEVKGIIPSAYQESGDFIGLNFNPIVAALTKAVQELKAELDILKNK